jgi:prepilin-type N-terminal cleavage/methylation domain-containing protein
MFGRNNYASRNRQRMYGFSLLEMMIVIAILTIVLGIVVEGIAKMQQRNFSESAKVDTVQETRDFVDQMVRDIHSVGYPPTRLAVNNPNCTNIASISCGVISFSSTSLVYEGDLDGSGTVYRVFMDLVPSASGNCPCTLRRGAISKTQALAGTTPTYFTQVNGVLNSGDGTGTATGTSSNSTYGVSLPGSLSYTAYSTTDVFNAYDQNAAPYGSCPSALVPDCSGIRSVQISINVAPQFADPTQNTYAVVDITSKARLNN